MIQTVFLECTTCSCVPPAPDVTYFFHNKKYVPQPNNTHVDRGDVFYY